MICTLGIDTSNYTSSVALYDIEQHKIYMRKKLLPVKEGQLGLRQSDAVFAHIKQLGNLFEDLFAEVGRPQITAIGVSTRPRNVEGSYMPCFTVGQCAAEMLSATLQVKTYPFSHQQGHIAAALYSADRLDMLKQPFYAFHGSGGTTEFLDVQPDAADLLRIERLAQSLDLKAGQAIDRVGNLLGLDFPAGPAMDKLAQTCTEKIKVKPVMKDLDCCLSGIENQCATMLKEQKAPEYIAKFCLKSIEAAVISMTERCMEKYGRRPVLYAGGVMSNSLIRASICARFGKDVYFAEPAFSADNAAGIAILAHIAQEE